MDIAELVVRDTGVGMTEEVIESVFELFSQGRKEPHKAESGMGVGLAIVRGIIELHNGAIEANSSGVGLGSEFRIKLPIDKDSHPRVPRYNSDESIRRKKCEKDVARSVKQPVVADQETVSSILIIDDLDAGREMLAQILELYGFRVTQADSGRSAKALLIESNDFDAILIDIGLPDVSGFELAKLFRERRVIRQGTKLIAITGYGQQKDIQASRDAGFDAHLTKPVNLERLLEIIRC